MPLKENFNVTLSSPGNKRSGGPWATRGTLGLGWKQKERGESLVPWLLLEFSWESQDRAG